VVFLLATLAQKGSSSQLPNLLKYNKHLLGTNEERILEPEVALICSSASALLSVHL
jgi:hypothetical protein